MLNCGPSGEYWGCQGPRAQTMPSPGAVGQAGKRVGVAPVLSSPCSCLLLRGTGEKLGLEQTSPFLWESASLWAVRVSGLRLALEQFPSCVLHWSPPIGNGQKTGRGNCCKVWLPVWAFHMALVVKKRRHGFDPWGGKIPWRRAWQHTLVFLPGESHGQRILVGYSP